jgi:hypothetical protein
LGSGSKIAATCFRGGRKMKMVQIPANIILKEDEKPLFNHKYAETGVQNYDRLLRLYPELQPMLYRISINDKCPDDPLLVVWVSHNDWLVYRRELENKARDHKRRLYLKGLPKDIVAGLIFSIMAGLIFLGASKAVSLAFSLQLVAWVPFSIGAVLMGIIWTVLIIQRFAAIRRL